jgi:fumarate reductase flavoprotein subunit
MGQSVGATLYGHNRGLLLVTPGFARELEVYLPGWLVYVNRDGRRFIDETIEYSVLAAVLKEQTGGECLAVFDEDARARRAVRRRDRRQLDGGSAHGARRGREDPLRRYAGRTRRDDRYPRRGARDDGRRVQPYCEAGIDSGYFKPPQCCVPCADAVLRGAHPAGDRLLDGCWPAHRHRCARARSRGTPDSGTVRCRRDHRRHVWRMLCSGRRSIANAIVFGRIAGAAAARVSRTSRN